MQGIDILSVLYFHFLWRRFQEIPIQVFKVKRIDPLFYCVVYASIYFQRQIVKYSRLLITAVVVASSIKKTCLGL